MSARVPATPDGGHRARRSPADGDRPGRPRRAARTRAETGSVGLTLLLPVVVAATLVLLVGAAVGGVHLADARASDAADAAAIAVVHARLAGHRVPCAAAGRAVAAAPGDGWVAGCRATDDGGARVTVAVRVPVELIAFLGSDARLATAAAAPVWDGEDR